MPALDLQILQLQIVRYGGLPKIVARSEGIDFAREEMALRMSAQFGSRPAGLPCPQAIFARPIGTDTVAVVQVHDLADGSTDPPLFFRMLFVPRRLYQLLGDPFALSARFTVEPERRGSLPVLDWPPEPLPTRQASDLLAILKTHDSALLLGATQALLDGAYLALAHDSCPATFVPALWQLLPDRVRCELWPASFAFSPELHFHVAVLPLPSVANYLDSEMTKDYPEGRYELALQLAIESGDQPELDRLLARKSSQEVLQLALGMFLFAVVVAAILKFL